MINGIQLKFTFSTLVADNLAAHQIGGYRTSFSSGNFCRRCHVSFDNHRLPSSVSTIQWRTALDHDRCLNQIQSDPLQRPVLGITGPSVLETLIGFHPTTALPADCMHDFFEGSCPHVIMLLLKEASAARLITYGKQLKLFSFFKNSLFYLQHEFKNASKILILVFLIAVIDHHQFSLNI